MTTLAPTPGARMDIPPAEEARITLDSVWFIASLNVMPSRKEL